MKACALKLLGIAFPLFAATAFADVTYYVSPGGDGTDPTSGNLTKAYAHPQTAIDAADGTTTFSNCRIKSTDSISVDSNGNSMRAFSMSGSAVRAGVTVPLRLTCGDGKWIEKKNENVPAGDGHFEVEGLGVGEWAVSVTAFDRSAKLPSHTHWQEFRVREKGACKFPKSFVVRTAKKRVDQV